MRGVSVLGSRWGGGGPSKFANGSEAVWSERKAGGTRLARRKLRPLLGVFHDPAEGRDRVAQLIAPLPLFRGACILPLGYKARHFLRQCGHIALQREHTVQPPPVRQQ